MSADLVLLAAPTDPEWLETYRYLDSREVIGDGEGEKCISWEDHRRLRAQLRLDALEHLWIGQVSWIKASFGEPWQYIPPAVLRIHHLVQDQPILTPGLAKEITVALNLPNWSIYGKRTHYRAQGRDRLQRKPSHDSVYQGTARPRVVKKWLTQHVGQRVLAESW